MQTPDSRQEGGQVFPELLHQALSRSIRSSGELLEQLPNDIEESLLFGFVCSEKGLQPGLQYSLRFLLPTNAPLRSCYH